VVKLRRLTERDPKNPVLIRTIRGVGYMLAGLS
jgi:DNA-binding response OmpR family regulator